MSTDASFTGVPPTNRDTTARVSYFEACARTVSQYTPDAFERAVRAVWGEILSNHA